MTDPRFKDLTELSRRMTSSLDLRTLSEDVAPGAIRATGAATAAIALWDRERDVLMALTAWRSWISASKMASGEVFTRSSTSTRPPAGCSSERQALSVEVGHATRKPG